MSIDRFALVFVALAVLSGCAGCTAAGGDDDDDRLLNTISDALGEMGNVAKMGALGAETQQGKGGAGETSDEAAMDTAPPSSLTQELACSKMVACDLIAESAIESCKKDIAEEPGLTDAEVKAAANLSCEHLEMLLKGEMGGPVNEDGCEAVCDRFRQCWAEEGCGDYFPASSVPACVQACLDEPEMKQYHNMEAYLYAAYDCEWVIYSAMGSKELAPTVTGCTGFCERFEQCCIEHPLCDEAQLAEDTVTECVAGCVDPEEKACTTDQAIDEYLQQTDCDTLLREVFDAAE